MADEQSQKVPMYVSFLTFTNMLDWLREMQTIPSKFDRSFWGKKFGGSTGGQLVAGLKFLGLLVDDNTTPELERLAMASETERKAQLADLLRNAYGSGIVEALPKMTPKMLGDAFDTLGATDATKRKAMSFFVNAAKAAELPMQSSIAKQARNRPGATIRRSPTPRTGKVEGTDGGGAGTEVLGPALGLPPGLPATVRTILEDLPRLGPTWDQATNERWHTTFKAVLDYAYPVKEKGAGH